jgi:DHA1 family bicyclomycin/chloramphenicol resistance-like MFS transporter
MAADTELAKFRAMLRTESLGFLLLLAALTSLGPLSTDMYLPTLPALKLEFAADVGRVQLTLSLFLVGFAVTQLIYGPVSDRLGRKKPILFGLALFVVGTLSCTFAWSIEALIAGRFLQALGACAGVVLGRAVVRDLFTRERAARMLAYLGMAMSFAPMIAPTVGGYLQLALGWKSVFVAQAVFGLILFVLAWRKLPESNQSPDPHALSPRRMLRNYATLLTSRRYVGFALAVAAGYAGLFSWISGSSFVLIDVYGVPSQHFGLYFAGICLGYIVGTLTSARLGMRLGLERMMIIGTGVIALGGVGMLALVLLHLDGPLALLAPMMVFTVGLGFVMPQGQAGALSPFPQMAGSAAALMGSLQFAIAAIVGAIGGHGFDGTAFPMALSLALSGLVSAGAYHFIARR